MILSGKFAPYNPCRVRNAYFIWPKTQQLKATPCCPSSVQSLSKQCPIRPKIVQSDRNGMLIRYVLGRFRAPKRPRVAPCIILKGVIRKWVGFFLACRVLSLELYKALSSDIASILFSRTLPRLGCRVAPRSGVVWPWFCTFLCHFWSPQNIRS